MGTNIMPEGYYTPNYMQSSGIGTALSNASIPPVLPKEGDKILLKLTSYGTEIISSGSVIPVGSDVIEVEVKRILKGHVNLV